MHLVPTTADCQAPGQLPRAHSTSEDLKELADTRPGPSRTPVRQNLQCGIKVEVRQHICDSLGIQSR